MAWTKLYQALPTHPKTLHLAELLGFQDTDLAWAKVSRLWLWALDYCPDGRLTVAKRPMTDGQIARAANFNGDPTVFVRSLIEVGFIDTSPGGAGGRTLQIHDWEEYGGKLHETREAEAERKRVERRAGRPADVHTDGDGRVDKSRVDKKEERRGEAPPPSLAPQGDPEPLKNDPSATPAGSGPEEEALTRCVDAYAVWDHPGRDRKVEAFLEMREAGMSWDFIRNGSQVNKPADAGFWDVVKALKVVHGTTRRAKAPATHELPDEDRTRVNGNPTGMKPAVLHERREVVHARQDAARKKADEALAKMDQKELERWATDAHLEADAAKIPKGPGRDTFVASKLRSRAAQVHLIEGL